MKKTTLLLFFVAVLIPLLFAQKKSRRVDVIWGETFKESRKYFVNDIVGHDKTGIYILKSANKMRANTFQLQHFNNKMNPTISIEYQIKKGKLKGSYESIIQLNNNLFLLTNFYDKKTNNRSLYAQKINKKTLLPESKYELLLEVSMEGFKKRNRYSDFRYAISRDSSKFLIFTVHPVKKDGGEQIQLKIMDSQMTPIWEKKILFDNEYQLLDFERIKVDNKGNTHLLTLEYKDKRKEKRHGEPNYNYKIISYFEKGNKKVEYPVKLDNKFITDMQIAITDSNNIVCAGFYSDNGTFSIKGSYFLSIDTQTNQVTKKNFKEFEIDFITQNMTEKEAKKTKKRADKGKDVELYEYDLDNLVLRDDGGVLLIGEQYYVYVTTYTISTGNGGVTTVTTTHYVYNDIVVVNINNQGEIEWTEKIAKRQRTSNDGGFYSSYTQAVIGDKLYFVFNDTPKNLIPNSKNKIYNTTFGKRNVVVLIEVNSDGMQAKEVLFSKDDTGVLVRPKMCKQINKKQMVLYGRNKKNKRFAMLKFK